MRPIVAVLLVAVAADAIAMPYVQPRPPRPVPAEVFAQLVDAMRGESFPDGKLERLRAVSGGKRYLFDSGQAITVLDLFAFWNDRLEALRLLPLVDAASARAVRRYFESAPDAYRSEAQRILGDR
jgi:hypothetical protein